MFERLKSRKFFVFIIWCILGFYLVFSSASLTEFIPNFALISMLYLGGQSAVDAAEKINNKKR